MAKIKKTPKELEEENLFGVFLVDEESEGFVGWVGERD